MITQRIWNKKGQPVGWMVAKKINGEVKVGWSFCNIKKDRFSPTLGKEIALGRAENGVGPEVKIPRLVVETSKSFLVRTNKYFKV